MRGDVPDPIGSEPITDPTTNASTMRTAPGGDPPGAPSPDGVGRVVCVLAKAPVAGRVKTRLTPPATPAGAAGVAAAALLDTLDAALAVDGAAVLVTLEGEIADAERADELARTLQRTTVVGQRGDCLGARIAAAHEDLARLFPRAASVTIAMDTPQVDARLLGEALDLVEGEGHPADAALGPALDGGWWALALTDPRHAGAIADVPTSRDDTGRRTLEALRASGLDPARVLELPPLSDVDTADDAAAVSRLVPAGRFARAVHDLILVPGGLPR